MKTSKLILAFAASIPAILFSCKKEKATPGILYTVKTSNQSSAVARISGGNLQWTSGYASAVEIEFEATRESVEVEYKAEVKQKIDLFASLTTLSAIAVPEGTYEDIEFEVEVQPNGTDEAFQLNGEYTSGGVTTPVVFKISTPLEIETKKENFTVTGGSIYTALTTFNLSLLTQGITDIMMNSATRTNGVIILSATSNTDIYNIMYDRLRNCGGIEVD